MKMSSPIVFDASALLALIENEKGSGTIEKHLPQAIMSSVNAAEVVAVLSRQGVKTHEAEKILLELLTEIVPFDYEQAILAGSYKNSSKKLGLSLGDCACFALAQKMSLPLITCDKAWEKFNANVEVVLAR